MDKLDAPFLTYASDVIAETHRGISGIKIVEYCISYSKTFNRPIPYDEYPFDAPNKRTALKENLMSFGAAEQFKIIKELCELPDFEGNDSIAELKRKLYAKYGNYADDSISESVTTQEIIKMLSKYPSSLEHYQSAIAKFEGGIYDRNTLDDIRLSLETLAKDILGNDKSLENQISGICQILEEAGIPVELRNMVHKIIDYYMKFHNNHVKHVKSTKLEKPLSYNRNEMVFVLELTNAMMKLMINAKGGAN